MTYFEAQSVLLLYFQYHKTLIMKKILILLACVFAVGCNDLKINDKYGFNDEDLQHLKTELMSQVIEQNGGGIEFVKFNSIDIEPAEEGGLFLVYGTISYTIESQDLKLLQSFGAKSDGTVVLTSQPINKSFFK